MPAEARDNGFVHCECGRKLAKKIGPGRYESKMKHNKTTYFAVEIIVGTIPCPKCGYRLEFPLSSIKEPNNEEQRKCLMM